jgi:hypothetical protein
MFVRSSRHAVGSIRRHLAISPGEVPLPSFYSQRVALSHYHSATDDHDEHFDNSQRPGRRRRSFRLQDRRSHQKILLDVDTLGKPGEIVVVPHPRRRRQAPETQDAAEKGQSSTDDLPFILRELESEQLSQAETDFTFYIEELRSTYQPGDKLHQEEWMELREKVEQSFTSNQLSDYISRSLASEQGGQQSQSGEHGTWKPGKSLYFGVSGVTREHVANRVARDQDLTGKKLLSEQVLRDCWQLGVADETGQLDIQLPPHAISLLLRSDRCSFQELAQSHQAKIDVSRSLNLVRITGSQTSCESIHETIEDFVSRIREDPADLSFLNTLRDSNGDPSIPEFLDWVDTAYGIACEREGRQSQGTVYYSADNKTMADRARRDLDLANQTRAVPAVSFCTYVSSSQQANVYEVNTEGTTSWVDRGKHWFRWSMQSARSDDPYTSPAPLFDQHYPRLSSDILGQLRGTPNMDAEHTEGDIDESLTAVVGKCLFLHQPTMSETTVSASRLGQLSLPRIFTGDVPKLSSLLRVLTPFPGSDSEYLHRIKLTPSSTNTHPMPLLEVEIGVKDGEDLAPSASGFVVRKVRTIVKEDSIDYLLPENGLDIRFIRTSYRNLLDTPGRTFESDVSTRDDAASVLEEIKRCLEQVIANYDVFGDAALPAFCHLQLPRSAVETSSSSGGQSTGTIGGEYLFPSVASFLGTRRFLYDFHGEKLSYGYSESGPLFPEKTTHLSLEMDVVKGGRVSEKNLSDEEILQKEFLSFYRTACKVAFELGGVHGKV